MSDRLFALRLFARVARKGNFSAASRELNIPQSTASRTIATLEREIGVALFVRTTRVVTLTDAGLDFLARVESVLAASPAYLDKAGAPHTPTDLPGHAIILGPASLGGHWSFRKGDTATSFQVEGKMTIRASLGAIAAAVEGLGVVMTPLGACRRELERGELVRLLPEWDAGTVELNAVYVSGRAAKPSARAFIDHLVAALHATEPPLAGPPSIGEKPRQSA